MKHSLSGSDDKKQAREEAWNDIELDNNSQRERLELFGEGSEIGQRLSLHSPCKCHDRFKLERQRIEASLSFRYLNDQINKYKPHVVDLMEPRKSKSHMSKLASRLGYHGCVGTDCKGKSGGFVFRGMNPVFGHCILSMLVKILSRFFSTM